MNKIIKKTDLYKVVLTLKPGDFSGDTYYASIQTRLKFYIFYSPWKERIKRHISVSQGNGPKELIDGLVEKTEKEYKDWIEIQ